MAVRSVIILALSFLTKLAFSATYYFAASGDDVNNTGITASSPFKTISKLNSIELKPGDIIYFNRGDIFEGQITISYSGTSVNPITLNAYGTGNLPVISGLTRINGWRLHTGNIYVTDIPSSVQKITQIFVNGSLMTLARYPDTGFLSIDSTSGKTSLFSKSLTQGTDYWKDATIVARTERWVYEKKTVIRSVTGKIEADSPVKYEYQKGFGFFLENKLNMLNTAGEWYFDSAARKLYFIAPGSVNPALLNIEASVYDFGIEIFNKQYISINNLNFLGQAQNGINTSSCNSISIISNNFQNIYRNGISTGAPGGKFFRIITNTFRNIGNNGIDANHSSFSTIKGNTLKRIALIPGYGGSGDGEYIAIISGTDSQVSYNAMDSVGYNGIHCHSRDTVFHNYIKNTCLTKDDGAGLYCYESDHIILRNNIIINSKGNGEATDNKDETFARGIYLDDSSSYNTLLSNTVINADYGIFVHNSFNNTLDKNILYNNRKAQLVFQNDKMVAASVNIKLNEVKENVLYCINPEQLSLLFWTYKNSIRDYGKFTSNYYCNPYNKVVIKSTTVPYYPTGTLPKVQKYTLDTWKSVFGQDLESSVLPINFPPYYNVKNLSENLISNSTFLLNKNDWYKWGSENFTLNLSVLAGFLDNALRTDYNTNALNTSGFFATGNFPVTAGSFYKLSFRSKSIKSAVLGFDVTQSTYPYSSLTNKLNHFNIHPGGLTQEYVFQATSSDPTSRIQFNSTVYDSTIWIDDVSLMRVAADTNTSKPRTTSPIFINYTSSPKTINLNTPHVDVAGNSVCNSFTLQPYSSRVLIKVAVCESINSSPILATKEDIAEMQQEKETPVVWSVPAMLNQPVYIQHSGFSPGSTVGYTIADSEGREILKAQSVADDLNRIEVPTSGLYRGIFLVRISQSQEIITAKIVLN
jgi:parallel beta-helix repeat protein